MIEIHTGSQKALRISFRRGSHQSRRPHVCRLYNHIPFNHFGQDAVLISSQVCGVALGMTIPPIQIRARCQAEARLNQ